MNYWLCLTNIENWKVILDKKIWGVDSRYSNKLEEVVIDDKLLIYVTLESKIYGLFEAKTKMFSDSTQIFKGPSGYTKRIKIELVKLPKEPINFKEAVSNLKFIKNKSGWQGYLRGSKCMRKIPKEDFEYLLDLF